MSKNNSEITLADVVQHIDELASSTAHSFNHLQDDFGFLREEVNAIKHRMDKAEERQLYLEIKIDKRFDLLESIMNTNRKQDRDELKSLAVRVTKLESTT